MEKDNKTENINEPVFIAKSNSASVLRIVLFYLILVLLFVLIIPWHELIIGLIASLIFFSILYVNEAEEIAVFILFRDSIEIKYPYLPYLKKSKFQFKSIQGIVFDESPVRAFKQNYWYRINFYYSDENGMEIKKSFKYRLNFGDRRKVISLLREAGIQIKGDEKYFQLT